MLLFFFGGGGGNVNVKFVLSLSLFSFFFFLMALESLPLCAWYNCDCQGDVGSSSKVFFP